MPIAISAKQPHGGEVGCRLVQIPDLCPSCGNHGEPTFVYGSILAEKPGKPLSAVFRCPVSDCQKLYIAEYKTLGNTTSSGWDMLLQKCHLARTSEPHVFPENVETISELFCTTYNQALVAEENGLDQICGPGYRKALEFLVKDYLIKSVYEGDEKKQADVLKAFLGPVIEKHVDQDRIKQCAKRAAWLGNDETHYTRKWEDKDIKDLKSLILMTVSYIDLTMEADRYLEEMP